ncbi:MAG: oxidative damage protection protein [Gammaproteobacteria bacterium]|nr:oxidative damage protection protein [Gammaproteobacteria bacterium]MBP9729678.1 oxidative damage protection protein [Gammaproteobacteria bacterium]
MPHLVYCKKLHKSAEGLDRAPCAGTLGESIYQHISKEAWALWLQQQTILINENRLKMIDPQARQFLRKEMQAFLLGDMPLHG